MSWHAIGLLCVSLAGCRFGGTSSTERDAGPDAAIDAAIDAALDAPSEPNLLDDCVGLPTTPTATQTINPSDDLAAAVASAAPGDVLELAPGVHQTRTAIVIATDDLTIRGGSADASLVIVEATDAMTVFSLQASNVTLGNFTLPDAATPIRVSGAAAADTSGVILYNLVFSGTTEVAVHVDTFNAFNAPPVVTDRVSRAGVLACSQFRPAVGSCDGDAAIRVFAGDGWRISKNRVAGYDCAAAAGDAIAIHVKDVSDPVVDRNLIREYQRGVVIGESTTENVGACDPTGVDWSVLRGVVCNNDLFDPDEVASVGVVLEQACDTVVVHNTIYAAATATSFFAGEANTRAALANNFSNVASVRSEGAAFDTTLVSSNQLVAPDTAFADPGNGNLTPVPGATQTGRDLAALTTITEICDVDRIGRVRNLAAPTFVGAYEQAVLP